MANPNSKASWFTRFANGASRATGKPVTFVLALLIVVVWGVTGPIFGFSDTWQLIINTGTTIVTFLMVFLIQNTQNRDSEAMHVKMDELIRARDRKLAAKAREDIKAGKVDIGCDDVDPDDADPR